MGIDSSGHKIVEEAMKRLMVDIRITFLLTPLQGKGVASSVPRPVAGVIPTISKSAAKRARKAAAVSRGNPPPVASAKGKGKGKTKGKGKSSPLPAGLEGCWYNVDGVNVCTDYQFGKCKENVADGECCSKGVHKCCTPQCKGLHGHFECRTLLRK